MAAPLSLLCFHGRASLSRRKPFSATDRSFITEKLTKGDPGALPSWNESLHFCEWNGVTCSHRHMRVSALHLENENWGGTLGPALGNLTFLKKLNLTNINLHGEIPTQIGHLKRLQVLELRKNNLHGPIPVQLTNCSKLQSMEQAGQYHQKVIFTVMGFFYWRCSPERNQQIACLVRV